MYAVHRISYWNIVYCIFYFVYGLYNFMQLVDSMYAAHWQFLSKFLLNQLFIKEYLSSMITVW